MGRVLSHARVQRTWRRPNVAMRRHWLLHRTLRGVRANKDHRSWTGDEAPNAQRHLWRRWADAGFPRANETADSGQVGYQIREVSPRQEMRLRS